MMSGHGNQQAQRNIETVFLMAMFRCQPIGLRVWQVNCPWFGGRRYNEVVHAGWVADEINPQGLQKIGLKVRSISTSLADFMQVGKVEIVQRLFAFFHSAIPNEYAMLAKYSDPFYDLFLVLFPDRMRRSRNDRSGRTGACTARRFPAEEEYPAPLILSQPGGRVTIRL